MGFLNIDKLTERLKKQFRGQGSKQFGGESTKTRSSYVGSLNIQQIKRQPVKAGTNFISACRIIALVLAIIATTFVVPIAIAFFYGEFQSIKAFAYPMFVVWAVAIFFFLIGRGRHFSMSVRGVFAVVACGWIIGSLLGAVPLVLSGAIPNFVDAYFESASGFSTTGATILSSVENLPQSINVWRCQMHWLGGMGIVALTVALLPLLGVGGFQLIKAETTGPEKGKVTPKITMTAKTLWFIYVGMTVVQLILLMIAGMPFVDALCHSFATLGTGGFSNRNASVGSYNSTAIDWICTVFMILAGVNFSLYFYLLTGKGRELRENTELKAYFVIIVVSILIVTISVLPEYHSFLTALRYSAFQTASIITTTGFATADFELWATPAQMVLLILMFIGGCSGSTGGGIKVARWVVLGKQMMNEVRRMLHPHGVFSIRLNNHVGRKDIVFNVAAFIFLYLFLVMITAFVATIDGADLLTASTTGLSLVGNIGPGFGRVGPTDNFGFYSTGAKIWFSFAMLAGRLELYTMLVFFIPDYWKK